MGKKITVYLTDEEFEILLKAGEKLGTDSMSFVIKQSLKNAFGNSVLVTGGSIVEHEHGKVEASILSKGTMQEICKSILKKDEEKKSILKKEGVEQ